MSFRFEAAERHVLLKREKALDFKWMQFVETNNARQSAEKQRKQSERVELKAKWAI